MSGHPVVYRSARVVTLFALAVSLASAAAYVQFAVLSRGGSPTAAASGDLIAYYYPALKYGFGELRQLRLPLWNPYQSCGTPFLAVPHVGFFYPLYLPFLVLPAELAITIDVIVHFAIAAFGTFVLGRYLGLSAIAASLAAAVYALQSAMAVKVFYPPFLAAVAWVPLVFVLVDQTLARGARVSVVLLAVTLAMMLLGGNPQFIYFTALALVPFVGARTPWRRPRVAFRGGALLAAAAALAVMLALVRLVPGVEYMRDTWRPPGGLSLEMAGLGATSPRGIAWALVASGTRASGIEQGYVGIVPLVLATTGLVLLRWRSWTVPMAIIAAGAALYAVGPGSPLFRVLFRLPGGAWFRDPQRGLVFVGLGVGLLAGGALDLARGPSRRQRVAVAAVFTVGAVLVVTLAAVVHAPAFRLTAAYAAAGTILLLATAVLPGPSRVAALAVLALVLVDLVSAGPPAGVLPQQLDGYFARYEPFFADIRARQGLDRTYVSAGFDPHGRLVFHSDLARAGLTHGIWDATDYEGTCPARVDRYLRPDAGAYPVFGSVCYVPLRLTADTLPLVRLMGVRFLLIDDAEASAVAAPGSDVLAAWRPLRRENGVTLYEDPGALPRAFLVHRVEVVPDSDTLLARMRSADLRTAAFVEQPLATDTVPAGTETGSAEVTEYAAGHVTIRARTEYPALLVVTDSYAPGWVARRDGHPVGIARTDYRFRGIEVPAGEHVVELEYRPRSIVLGAVGTILGVVATVLVAAGRRGRMRF